MGVKLIILFRHDGKTYPCILIHRFSKTDEETDINTGM